MATEIRPNEWYRHGSEITEVLEVKDDLAYVREYTCPERHRASLFDGTADPEDFLVSGEPRWVKRALLQMLLRPLKQEPPIGLRVTFTERELRDLLASVERQGGNETIKAKLRKALNEQPD